MLFALCRAIHENKQRHHIVYFEDYQSASLDSWDLAILPDNIRIHALLRAEIRKDLSSTFAGRVSYLCAMREMVVPASLRKPVIETLKSFDPELAAAVTNNPTPRLWLFNEWNKMARLFRLLLPQYSDIEEGEGNYLKARLPWYKTLPRILKGMPARYRVLGDNPHCNEIWVTEPERLPSLVRSKGRQIDFLDSQRVTDLIGKIFRTSAMTESSLNTVILATQPLDGLDGISNSAKAGFYEVIIDRLNALGKTVILKPHPKEDAKDYSGLTSKATLVPAKIPLETLIFGSADKIVIVTVISSAGMGYETYCERIKLCNNIYEYQDKLREWVADPRLLNEILDERLRLPAS